VTQKVVPAVNSASSPDRRYRRRNVPFNATPANGEVGWRLRVDSSGSIVATRTAGIGATRAPRRVCAKDRLSHSARCICPGIVTVPASTFFVFLVPKLCESCRIAASSRLGLRGR